MDIANIACVWEQRKLGEVGDFNPKCSLPKKFEYVDLESVDGTRLVSHRTEYIDNAPSRAQRLAKPGDIFPHLSLVKSKKIAKPLTLKGFGYPFQLF